MRVRVVYDPALPADRIVNLTSPRTFHEVAQYWKGKRDWWDPLYEPVRDMMERRYVAGMNAAFGHYERLEEDIRRNGIRNPVMLNTGGVRRRGWNEMPPHLRGNPTVPISERLGGSRIWVAQRLGITVPAIVNDFGRAYGSDADRLRTSLEVLAKFADKPTHCYVTRSGGAHVRGLPFTHLERDDRTAQREVRDAIVAEIKELVADWLSRHDREPEPSPC